MLALSVYNMHRLPTRNVLGTLQVYVTMAMVHSCLPPPPDPPTQYSVEFLRHIKTPYPYVWE